MTTGKRYNLTKQQLLFSLAALSALAVALCTLAFLAIVLGNDFEAHKIWTFFGLVFLSVFVFGFFLYYGDIELMKKRRSIVALCGIMFTSYALFILMERSISPFAVPYAFCALLIGLCLSRKTGYFATMIVSVVVFFGDALFGGVGTAGSYAPIAIGFSSGILGAFAYSRHSLRIKYIFVSFYIMIATVIASLLLTAAFEPNMFAEVWFRHVAYGILGSAIAISAFFFVTPIMDTLFKFATDFRLAELSSTDRPLLKKLFAEAPGTFNHCVTLANYAVPCATAINENTYLARAAAFYHDIGKIKNPLYFSENQSDGVNPHDELTPEVSVSIIKKHITNGIALAKKAGLPEEVIKAIAEHHGTLPLRFFYNKAQKYSETDLEDVKYRYDGAKPSNKMSALIMVCDACEAALRASKPGTREEAEEIVYSIINERIKYGQFSDCDITLKDFDLIRQTIVTVHAGISHDRISYPAAKQA